MPNKPLDQVLNLAPKLVNNGASLSPFPDNLGVVHAIVASKLAGTNFRGLSLRSNLAPEFAP